MYDMIIIGGGPAGLTAAVYGRRNGKSVLVIEKSVFGGQIVNTPKVENIPGFAEISGDEFADRLLDQAMGQGAEVTIENVTEAEKKDGIFVINTEEGGVYQGKSLILATGTTHRVLGLPGEEDLIGDGIHFCAVCDGDLYKDKNVVVIGGGNSAFVEANTLVAIAGKLTMLQDLPKFTADAKSQETLFSHHNVETHLSTTVTGYVTENGRLTGVTYIEGGENKKVSCDGVFLAVGLIPNNGPFANLALLNRWGYFEADETGATRTEGVFVAGDCRSKTLRQVATACSDGANAAINACNYLSAT
ncbi:MAG: FAD-dependent oxidoreductase [Clostridia bacterium]|nr:FAD-dependent oxidoreductase [Clostridia bacterium]MBR0445602.1 FAD-dependent oxidoreductase [Clostridia bacterium]